MAFAKPCAHQLEPDFAIGVLQAQNPQARILERAVNYQLESMLKHASENERKRVTQFVAQTTARPQFAPAVFQHGRLRLNSILRDHPLSWIAIPHEVQHFMDAGDNHWVVDGIASYVNINYVAEREGRAARIDYQLARRLVMSVGFDAERALAEIARLEPPERKFDATQELSTPRDDADDFDFESFSTAERRAFEVDRFQRADLTFRRLIHYARFKSEDEYVQMRLRRYRPDIRSHRNSVLCSVAGVGAFMSIGILHLNHFF